MTTNEKTTTEQSCGSVWMNGPDRVYLVESDSVCDGCVFATQGMKSKGLCPYTSTHLLACANTHIHNAIFITEIEYLKRQMR